MTPIMHLDSIPSSDPLCPIDTHDFQTKEGTLNLNIFCHGGLDHTLKMPLWIC